MNDHIGLIAWIGWVVDGKHLWHPILILFSVILDDGFIWLAVVFLMISGRVWQFHRNGIEFT